VSERKQSGGKLKLLKAESCTMDVFTVLVAATVLAAASASIINRRAADLEWSAKLYEDINARGRSLSITAKLDECVSLDDKKLCDSNGRNCIDANNALSSVDPLVNCLILYESGNCDLPPAYAVDIDTECTSFTVSEGERCGKINDKIRSIKSCNSREQMEQCEVWQSTLMHKAEHRWFTWANVSERVNWDAPEPWWMNNEHKIETRDASPILPLHVGVPPALPTDHWGTTMKGEPITIFWLRVGGVPVQRAIFVRLMGPRTDPDRPFHRNAQEDAKMKEMLEERPDRYGVYRYGSPDQMGHILARTLGGRSQIWNLVPQTRASNTGPWKGKEVQIAHFLNDPVRGPCRTVKWRVLLEYVNNIPRPHTITLHADFIDNGQNVRNIQVSCVNNGVGNCVQSAHPPWY
jgi:DNA/RNA non-specific endonuclease